MCKQTTVHFMIKLAFYTGFGNGKTLKCSWIFVFEAYKHKPIDQRPSDPKLHNKWAREIKIKFKYYRFSTRQIIYLYSLSRLKLFQKFLKANTISMPLISVTIPLVSANNNHANKQTTWLLSLQFNTRNLFFGIMYFLLIKKYYCGSSIAESLSPIHAIWYPIKRAKISHPDWLKLTFIICNFSL